MIHFKDFVPQRLSASSVYNNRDGSALREAVEAANAWIMNNAINVINLETVVLPSMWAPLDHGSEEQEVRSADVAHWYQFVRCWYRV